MKPFSMKGYQFVSFFFFYFQSIYQPLCSNETVIWIHQKNNDLVVLTRLNNFSCGVIVLIREIDLLHLDK